MPKDKPITQKTWNDLSRILLLAILILFTFSPCLNNPFLYWDDDTHILENPLVASKNQTDIPAIFQSVVNKTYIPLTILSFNLENRLFGLNPFFFHLDSILLHILVSILAYYFFIRIGFDRNVSFVAAILFAVHPMHVESIAWATARKDTLYSLFYILAMDRYWMYLKSEKPSYHILALVYAFLSILAKPMALSLPLILGILDWYKNKKITAISILRLIPFLVVIIPIAWLTYRLNSRIPHIDLTQSFLLWTWTATFYIKKFLTPFILLPLYQVPQPISLLNPSYWSGLLIFIGFATTMVIGRRNRLLLFAGLFYIASTFFLWRYDTGTDVTMVGDRFMYLPSLGFCLLIADALLKTPKLKWILIGIVLFCIIKTSAQCRIWQSDISLWNYVIEHKQEVYLAYNSRAVALVKQNADASAMSDFKKALNLNPNYPRGYYNLGKLFNDTGDLNRALDSFNKAISLNQGNYQYFIERGITLSKRKEYDKAIADFNTALRLQPTDARIYNNRGLSNKLMGNSDAALNDFTTALKMDPKMKYAYFNRGNLWQEMKNYKAALNDFRNAQGLGYPVDPERLRELTALASQQSTSHK